MKGDKLITFEELRQLPLYEDLSIYPEEPNSIITKKIHQCQHNITFRVEMEKFTTWEPHHHDCLESILIYKGTLRDNETGAKATRGDLLIVPAFYRHSFTAEAETIFYVDFKRPEK